MPETVADLAATPVWLRISIEAMKRGESLPPVKKLPLVGLSEVAEICGVDKSQIGRWRRAGTFPEPCLDRRSAAEPNGLSAGPLWWRSDITAFKRKRKR
jgi:transcriptional regulator with XRE-family HTH domain